MSAKTDEKATALDWKSPWVWTTVVVGVAFVLVIPYLGLFFR